MQSRASYAFIAGGVVAGAAYVVAEDALVKAALIVAVATAASTALAFGIRAHRPNDRAPWLLLLAAHAVWAAGWVFWELPIVRDGTPPATDALVNVAFLTGNFAAAGALALLAGRIDRSRLTPIDVGVVFCAVFAIAWAWLLHRYVENDELPVLGRGFQVAYAIADIIILALVVRVLASARALSVSTAFLVASGVGVVASDGIWNWSTQLEDYVPGSWADLGWVAFHVFAGAAALHPSMRVVFERAADATLRGRSARLSMLVFAMLVPPLVLTSVGTVFDEPLRTLPIVAAAVVLALLVILRMHFILRDDAAVRAALAAQNKRLLELDTMKDEFVAAVSHELRTPLTSIRGYLELVLDGEGGELTGDQRQFLGVVDRNADRLLRVVSDLLFVAQVDAGKLAIERGDVDLAQALHDAVGAARPAADARGVELALDLEPLPSVRGDAARLGQLFDNLLSNAIKFTPAGGSVNVRARRDSDGVVVEVADTGIGIPVPDQEHLFERFFRTSDATEHAVQGTGLGLAIAKAIAEAHGGTIGVESEHGRGTTFRVMLPRDGGIAPAREPAAAAA